MTPFSYYLYHIYFVLMQGFKLILSLEVELNFLDKISRDTKLVKQQILILPDSDGEDDVGYNDDHGDGGEAGDPCAACY